MRRLVLAAAAVWLLFVVAHRLLSGRVWWWILPDLAPPVAFLVVPMALLLAIPLLAVSLSTAPNATVPLLATTPRADGPPTRPAPGPPTRPAPGPSARRASGRATILGPAALALVSVVVGWPAAGVHPVALGHRPGPVPPGAVTVFSWNTFYWDRLADPTAPPDPDGGPARDPDRFYRHLRAQRADVYLLQEYLYFTDAWEPVPIDHTERLRREFPGFHLAVAGELVTLSRFPIVGEQALDLRPWLERPQPDLPPPGTLMPDYYPLKTLRTDVRIVGRVVSFYNSHIVLPVAGPAAVNPGELAENRAAQDRRRAGFRALAADAATNPHPIVLAGDLNTSPAMGLIRTLPDRLVDAVGATGRVYPVSWSWHGVPLWRLDWVFTTADVDVHRYRLVPADDQSDHRGQHVTLSLGAG